MVGDALAIWGGAERSDQAIDAYTRALALDPSYKNALFRLGVAHRMRHESARRRPGDFQAAIDAWGRALALDPNRYIWRRRIEQYGPRLAKPYAFSDWVVSAKAEISRSREALQDDAPRDHARALRLRLVWGADRWLISSPRDGVVRDAASVAPPDPRACRSSNLRTR